MAILLVILVLVVGFSSPIQAQQIIEITSEEYSFGTVTIGNSATTIVTIQKTNVHSRGWPSYRVILIKSSVQNL